MSNESDKVVYGFMSLNDADRSDVIQEINRYQREGISTKILLSESAKKRAGIDLGPTGVGSCPCCGRG